MKLKNPYLLVWHNHADYLFKKNGEEEVFPQDMEEEREEEDQEEEEYDQEVYTLHIVLEDV